MGSRGSDAAIWDMGVDNGIAYHIGMDSFIVDSFTQKTKDSCHICPNNFRVAISQLISNYGHFPMIAYPLFWNLHASVMCVAKVVRKCVVNICIVFTFGAIHVIYLWLNDCNLMRQKAVSGKNPYFIWVFASFCQ